MRLSPPNRQQDQAAAAIRGEQDGAEQEPVRVNASAAGRGIPAACLHLRSLGSSALHATDPNGRKM